MRFQAILFDPFCSHVLQCLHVFVVMWSCFVQDASKNQTALGSAISGIILASFFPKGQSPRSQQKPKESPRGQPPALPLGRHRRSHIDFNLILLTVALFLKPESPEPKPQLNFNLILLTVAWFWKVASPKPSYCQQFHPKP